MLDTLTPVETPEGIALQLRAAGPIARACAWAIDALIRAAVIWGALMVVGVLGASGIGVLLLLGFALMWVYPVLFEVLRDGQTPGKRAMGLRVVSLNGTPVGWIASIVRNLMRVVDMLPLLYGFGFVATLIDPHARRIGDLVAGTLVVHDGPVGRNDGMPPAPVVHAPLPLSARERASIVAFAERAPLLTPERQQELAGLLPMLTDAAGPLAVQRLHGMANAFVGRT